MPSVKVPRQITIGGHNYEVYFNPELRDENDWGNINFRKQIIAINPERPPSQKAAALIHEILHAVNRAYISERLEESIIAPLSEGLAQVMKSFDITLDWSDIKEVP